MPTRLSWLLKMQRGVLEVDELRSWAEQLGLSGLLERVLAEAGLVEG